MAVVVVVERAGDISTSQASTTRSHHSQPDEELSPVTSRQLVENLVKENAKLRQHLQNPRKIEELTQVSVNTH